MITLASPICTGPKSVHDRHAADRPFLRGVGADARQFFFRHLGIGFIVERNHFAAFVIIARRTDKRRDRARLGIGDIIDQFFKSMA